MNDIRLHARILAACAQAGEDGVAVLFHGKTIDDPVYLEKLHSVEQLFDCCVGGTTTIAGKTWQLFERKRDDGHAGVTAFLSLHKQAQENAHSESGMVTQNRPRTAKEWAEWQAQYILTHGGTLRTVEYTQPTETGIGTLR